MSKLSDLEAALEAGLGDSHIFPCGRDTIAALIAVARAAERMDADWHSANWPTSECYDATHAALAPLVKEADSE